MMIERRIMYALLAGLLGSLGSCFGKMSSSLVDSQLYFPGWLYAWKAALFVAMLVGNTVGCTFYAKSLNLSDNTLEPTLISSAANYVFSGVFGRAVFEEHMSGLWWLGTCSIVSGLVLIVGQQPKRSDQPET